MDTLSDLGTSVLQALDSGNILFLLTNSVFLLLNFEVLRLYFEFLKFYFNEYIDGVNAQAFIQEFIGFVDKAVGDALNALIQPILSLSFNPFASAVGTITPYVAESNVQFKNNGKAFCDIIESFATNTSLRTSLSNYITDSQNLQQFLKSVQNALPKTIYGINVQQFIENLCAIYNIAIGVATTAESQATN